MYCDPTWAHVHLLFNVFLLVAQLVCSQTRWEVEPLGWPKNSHVVTFTYVFLQEIQGMWCSPLMIEVCTCTHVPSLVSADCNYMLIDGETVWLGPVEADCWVNPTSYWVHSPCSFTLSPSRSASLKKAPIKLRGYTEPGEEAIARSTCIINKVSLKEVSSY